LCGSRPTLQRGSNSSSNGVLLSHGDDRKFTLQKQPLRIAALVPWHNVYVHMRYVLAGLDAIVLENVGSACAEGRLYSTRKSSRESVHACDFRVRDIQHRLSVGLWYHERRAALVVAVVDKRGSKIILRQESALKFPRNVFAEAA